MKRYDLHYVGHNQQNQVIEALLLRTVRTKSESRIFCPNMVIVSKSNCISPIWPQMISLELCRRRYSKIKKDFTRKDCSWSKNSTNSSRKILDSKHEFPYSRKKKISYPESSILLPKLVTKARAGLKPTRALATSPIMTPKILESET